MLDGLDKHEPVSTDDTGLTDPDEAGLDELDRADFNESDEALELTKMAEDWLGLEDRTEELVTRLLAGTLLELATMVELGMLVEDERTGTALVMSVDLAELVAEVVLALTIEVVLPCTLDVLTLEVLLVVVDWPMQMLARKNVMHTMTA